MPEIEKEMVFICFSCWESNNREQQHKRKSPITRTSKQRKERENTRFNEVRQLAYVLGAERERVLIKTKQLQVTISRAITPLYIGVESLKERKPTTLNSDQKRIHKPSRIRPESFCYRQFSDKPDF